MIMDQVVDEVLGVGEADCLPSSDVLCSMCDFDRVLGSLMMGWRM